MLSYDLHVHPGPSAAPRWGDGERVWQAAADAGVAGFVWKAHERHTAELCNDLPRVPVRAIGSASLNPWAGFDDVIEALEAGARWVWGPTLGPDGAPGWEVELPEWWRLLADWLAWSRRPVVLATGHLDAVGRAAFAELAARHGHLQCSVTHSLYVSVDELVALAQAGCVFEVDAYTLVHDLGRERRELAALLAALAPTGALVYFTSDGGQASTGDPFAFGARVLDTVAGVVGEETAGRLGVRNPAALVRWLDEGVPLR